jgi:hypothetical protein
MRQAVLERDWTCMAMDSIARPASETRQSMIEAHLADQQPVLRISHVIVARVLESAKLVRMSNSLNLPVAKKRRWT